MINLKTIAQGPLFFAPMEGITDEAFRKTILKLYPEWDILATDFLRVPSAGRYPRKHIIRHFGKDLSQIESIKEKTQFQILTSHRAFTEQMVQDIAALGYPWLDINLGCPSNTVTKNGGGSSLLKDLDSLPSLLKTIRETFKGRLTAKVRTGYADTTRFDEIIKILNDAGIEMITVHGRTREMMYKEPAQWQFIKRAVEISQVPIVGNGDIWRTEDIDRMFKETGCYGVMVARGALRSPWMAQDYRNGDIYETQIQRNEKAKTFLFEYKKALEAENILERGLLKQSKSISRYMFEDEVLRRKLLLSQTSSEFFTIIESL